MAAVTRLNQGCLYLEAGREGNSFSIFTGNKKYTIDEVDAPFLYRHVPVGTLISALGQMHLKMSVMSDATRKLWICPRLLGGMPLLMEENDRLLAEQLGIFDRNVDSKIVSDRIIAKLPSDVYESIGVHMLQHQFAGRADAIAVRRVCLGPRTVQFAVNILKALAFRRELVSRGDNRVASAILGSQDPLDIKALENSFRNNATLEVYYSLEGNNEWDYKFKDDEQTVEIQRARNKICVVS